MTARREASRSLRQGGVVDDVDDTARGMRDATRHAATPMKSPVRPQVRSKKSCGSSTGRITSPPSTRSLRFEREFSVRVTYDTYESNEEMVAKLVAGGDGYDIVALQRLPDSRARRRGIAAAARSCSVGKLVQPVAALCRCGCGIAVAATTCRISGA